MPIAIGIKLSEMDFTNGEVKYFFFIKQLCIRMGIAIEFEPLSNCGKNKRKWIDYLEECLWYNIFEILLMKLRMRK